MVAVPLFSITICQDSVQPIVKSSLTCERRTNSKNLFPSQKAFRCFLSFTLFNNRKSWLASCSRAELVSKTRMKRGDDHDMVNKRSMPFQNSADVHPWNNCAMDNHLKSSSNGISPTDKHSLESYSSATGCNERQLALLDSYFSKLQYDMNEERASCMPTSDFETMSNSGEYHREPTSRMGKKISPVNEVDQLKAKTGLGSLENYFDKLHGGMQTREATSLSSTKDDAESSLIRVNVISEDYNEKTASTVNTRSYLMPLENMDDETVPGIFGDKNFQDSQSDDEASDFYLINLLASIDIAVFLFEIASPIRSSSVEELSLPLIYGAKINKLILDGEWWRIVTPMFLHSGFLHIALGCWVLLTFGPQVCRVYGPFTFFLIYILGGICANLTSFIHTPELTVCGTGPVFAIIGAWLIYQVLNKEAMAKEVSEDMFWKAVFATAISFVLSNFEQVDEWSHLGAVLSGLIYGFLTCPATHFDKAPSESSQKEGITLIKQHADPCKSAAIFTLSIFIFCSLVFVFETHVDIVELDDLL